MAGAHVLSAIDFILEDRPNSHKENVVHSIKAALNASIWTDDMDGDHYELLSRAAERGYDAIVQWADDHRGYYVNLWLDLGMPPGREEWKEARRARRAGLVVTPP